MIKTLTALSLAIALTACSNGYSERNFPVLPDDLKDCKFYRVNNEDGVGLYVVRCPNSTTTNTTLGKNPVTTTVISN